MSFTPFKSVQTKRMGKPWTAVLFLLAFLFSLLVTDAATTGSQSPPSPAGLTSRQQYEALTFTTTAYREEALKLVLEEANRVAAELRLPDKLPITTSNLVESYISPPRMSQTMGTFGNVSTSNYTYCASVGNKFSFLIRRGVEREYKRLRTEYLLPMSQLNTNAALQLATQFLTALSMDVTALGRECDVHVKAYTPEGKSGSHFVPVYWVYWTKKGQEGGEPAADVELFEPTKTIHQLHVMNPDYILRKPLVVPNVDELLSETNSVTGPGQAASGHPEPQR
jgi:hypothetical protein